MNASHEEVRAGVDSAIIIVLGSRGFLGASDTRISWVSACQLKYLYKPVRMRQGRGGPATSSVDFIAARAGRGTPVVAFIARSFIYAQRKSQHLECEHDMKPRELTVIAIAIGGLVIHCCTCHLAEILELDELG